MATERKALTHKLSADNLTLIRGERCLFQGLSFALESSGLLILEGRNGCGKTSLIRAIAGMLSLEEGTIYWDDVPVEKQRQVFHGSLVWLAHRTGLKGDLTLVENLGFERTLRAHSSKDPEEVYERLGIARLKKLILRSLSAGQQRRVALARMLLADVPLWFMDEPFTNLDVAGREFVEATLGQHLQRGGMAIIATHLAMSLNTQVTELVIQ